MKKLLIGLLIVCSLSVMAQAITIPQEVKLNHRILNTCEMDSCYFDIFNMKQDYGYGLALEFGNDHGENKFQTVQVVDEFARIVDLGKGSCSTVIESNSDYDRKSEAWNWLNYSNAWDQLNYVGTEAVNAQEEHCYLMYKSSTDMHAVVSFHVKSIIKNVSVTIDELEIFKRSNISDL